jgi:hypothetical protein
MYPFMLPIITIICQTLLVFKRTTANFMTNLVESSGA